MMNKVIIARLFGLIVFLILSFGVHFYIFSSSNEEYKDVLFSHIFMYIVYFLFSLTVSEHFLNYLKK